MKKIMNESIPPFFTFVILFILSVLVLSSPDANAYERYNDGCTNCHGAFSGDTSPKGSSIGNHNKMDMHRDTAFMSNDCNLCHSSGPKENPYIASSRGTSENPGMGCTGCHGREEDAGNDSLPGGRGAGLRQHHWNANRIIDTAGGPVSSQVCGDCHSDASPANYTPVGEHVKPRYFGTGDTNANGPCNPIGQHNINENWTLTDFRGLDNDGDGLYDLNDPDCGGLPLCTDIDNDGYIDCDGTCAPGTLLCGDCNDSDDSLNPDVPELCDGIDNDCDGSIDEDFSALGNNCNVGLGACQTQGAYVCTADGSGIECDAIPGMPSAEICDSIDNDCDSSTDEDFPDLGTACTAGTGACESTGNYVCTADGSGTECDAIPGTPSAEICDGIDNDCDSSTDEDFPNLGTACTAGTGVCESTGNYVCTTDGSGTECDATPLPPGTEGPGGDPTCSDFIDNDCDNLTDSNDPDCSSCTPTGTPENMCNGVDDDCDGSIDEDYVATPTTCGAGECASTGQTTCAGGIEGDTCVPGTPSAELCDGLDNDCDNSFDEDFPDLGTACTVGTGACEASGNYICTIDGFETECNATPGVPGLEGPAGDPTCSDTIDNDCDNLADSNDPDCSSCIPSGIPETLCNGVDDNCDGFIDEDYVTVQCGLGACSSSSQCIDGTEIPCLPGPPIEPNDVTCDGLDGDCDGAVDEDYITTSTSCGVGACASTGQTTCVGGTEVDTCTPGTPGIEGPEGDPTCTDIVDNDCDGLSDGADNDCGAYTVPPVRQEIGRPDSAYSDLVEADCRFCHENPDQFPVDPDIIADRHHLLYNTIARVGTCSLTDTFQCQDDADCPGGETCSNGSDAPFPPPFGGSYDCFTCHDVDCSSGNCGVIIFKDCLLCHIQGPAEYTVHHRTDLSLGNLPQGPDCQFCHGDFVNNRDDGHIISTAPPTERTPKRSGGTGLPFNNRGNGAGACNYCHDNGTSVEGIVVETNMITHHNRGFGFDDTKCDWCHDFNLPFDEQIRICENCHGYTSLHNIQADSDGDGVISPGIEQPFYGHIGNPDDCWGCHGFGVGTVAPGSGAVIPGISSVSHSILVEGIDTTITITGTAFTNIDANTGEELTSTVVLTADDDSTIELVPDTISESTITETVPGILTTGTYRVQAVKQGKFSNPMGISVKPAVSITGVTCDKRKRLLTINGSGFSEKIEGTDAYISIKADNALLSIISWTDTQIKASVTRCSKHMAITIDSIFGTDTWNMKKKH